MDGFRFEIARVLVRFDHVVSLCRTGLCSRLVGFVIG
jgi:hypothetical protein